MLTDGATLRLGDGRTLSFALAGADDGPWCVHHHGTGSSRLEGQLLHETCRRHGVCLVTIDRPSHGRSSPDDDRRLTTWPADLVGVMDHLGVERFAVSGLSGGGPHALAAAALLPDRVTHAVIINSGAPTDDDEVLAGTAPRDRRVWTMARNSPAMFRRVVSPLMSGSGPLQRLLVSRLLPDLDRQLLADPTIASVMEAATAEGRRQPGNRFDEALLIWGGDWGFDPYDVAVPVAVFSGREDPGRAFAGKLAAVTPGPPLDDFDGGHLAFLAPQVLDRIGRAMHQVGAQR